MHGQNGDHDAGIGAAQWLSLRHRGYCKRRIAPCWAALKRRPGRSLATLLLPLLTSGCAHHAYLSFLDPQGPIAAAERTHFLWVLGILAVLVAGPIFLLTPWILWRYRYGAHKSAYIPKWKDSSVLLVMTWVGPVIIVIILGFMIWTNAHSLDPYKPIASNANPVHIEAIGYDWKWLFIYPDQGIASLGVMPIPVGRPVAMHLTSATVMQSLQIPALVGQIYAMGGMVTKLHFEADRAGKSLGENTMYNGKGFHQQKFIAHAMLPDAFKAWVKQVKRTGVPMDKNLYHMLTERNTVTQIAAALGQAPARYNPVYIRNVSDRLFPAVVAASMNDTTVAPDELASNIASAPRVTSKRKAVE